MITINQEHIGDISLAISLCPFGAIERQGGIVVINESCRMCLLCVKKGPKGAFVLESTGDNVDTTLDISRWKGILVSIEHHNGAIHPVSLELIGKAHELVKGTDFPIYAVISAYNSDPLVDELRYYGMTKILQYDDPIYSHVTIEPYAAALEDAIITLMPAVVLVGGTVTGRLLAPRVAARFRTGLTADCTTLSLNAKGELDQIRPAFGGNIMAHIKTPHHRPQFATVRYKVCAAGKRQTIQSSEVMRRSLPKEKLLSAIRVRDVTKKHIGKFIEESDVLIALGKGIGTKEMVEVAQSIASKLQGMVACTRPLVELGWVDMRNQIGLSGRTVRPKLLICFGISGSVQFSAGMNGAENIIAVNTDPQAPIFSVAHIGIVADAVTLMKELNTLLHKEEVSHVSLPTS